MGIVAGNIQSPDGKGNERRAPEKSTRKAGHEANHKTFMGIDDATVQVAP